MTKGTPRLRPGFLCILNGVRILFTRFPLESIPGGGAETQTMNLAKGLADRNHAVAFVGSCQPLLDAFDAAGMIHAEMVELTPPVTKFQAVAFRWKKKSYERMLVSMLDAFGELDAIVMLSMAEKLLLTDVAAARGIKVFWIEHDPVGRWLTKNPWKKLLLRQAALATTVTVSELSRAQYLDMGWDKKRTVAIPNGIDDAWFAGAVPEATHSTAMRLGYVGRLAEEKGVDLLLRAMADMNDATLDVVGDGPEEGALKRQAERLGLGHRVRFLGRRSDVKDFYAQIDALVLPSRTVDPFGMVVAEAMARGIPCVVSDACGIAACLEAADGVAVVRRESATAIAKGVQRVKEAATKASVRAGLRKIAKQQFAVSTMVDAYERLFTGKS